MESTNELKEKLKTKLKEMFQFENEDLDFGIYRIMNYKSKEIEKFIEEELINEIQQQLYRLSEEGRKELRKTLKEIKNRNGVKIYLESLKKGDEDRAKIYREDFAEDIEEYERLQRQLEEIRISEDLEKQIYNHLINFFSRYYDNGDFISKRRYGKNEKYIIPYNGEEVLLYWSNNDQYYIKTTEYFKKYTFRVKGLIINFKVVEAEEEKGNVKAKEKKFFVINEKVFDFDEEKKELNIYFEYRGLTNEEEEKYKHGNTISQDKANEETIRVLEENIPKNSFARLIFEKTGDKTIMQKHLYKYTRRNTTDYFIHKNLKGFLERELDFYIKNEVLHLEDLRVLEQSGYFDKLRFYLIGVRAFRNIALKIIKFLAQIENFQKKIWEKKKFVIQTDYVITLDKIKEYAGEDFLENIIDEVLSNEQQIEEWKKLFGIEIRNRNDLILNSDHLQLNGKEWKKLPIDTKYFDEEFNWKLLVALSENNAIDEILDGVLIKSENWQALNLLLKKYYEKIQTIYIDPPYNTGNDDFLYKDSYQHSSWLTMMENRLRLANKLMRENGVIFVSIDDNELNKLREVMNIIYGEDKFIANIIRQTRKGGGSDSKFMAIDNDYILSFIRSINKSNEWYEPFDKEYLKRYKYEDEKGRFFWDTLQRKGLKNPIKYEVIAPDGSKIKGEFIFSKERFEKELEQGNIRFIKLSNGNLSIQFKQYLNEKGKKPRSIFSGNLFLNSTGKDEVLNLLPSLKEYINKLRPKPVELVKRLSLISKTNQKSSFVLDFFAGTGTTAHAILKLNKEYDGKLKFVLVDMADYFDTVIIPRIKKVAYSFNWKEGRPQDAEGGGVFFKYHTLEQYEDALENIEFEKPQKELYEFSDYFVKYMLQWETIKSKTFLNLKEIENPFSYKIKIIENYQPKEAHVDLVETFNYLLGLHVNVYKVLEDNGRKYVFVFGEKGDRRVAIVWRNTSDIDYEKDKEIIENQMEGFNPDEIYVNGDSAVKGFKPIEPEFKTLMFEKVE